VLADLAEGGRVPAILDGTANELEGLFLAFRQTLHGGPKDTERVFRRQIL
jgi:hypothetical protein